MSVTKPVGLVDGNVAGGPRILVVDNYDSFVYNLVQYVGEFAGEVAVRRNDAVDLDGISEIDPDGIVLSPGPGTPASAGVSMDVFDLDCPIFGVCLGHQAMCAARGSRVGHAPSVVHGKSSTITHDGAGLFDGLPAELSVGRYHSLCVDRGDLPDALIETAHTTDEREVVMGVRHRERPQFGVQFHPESILTDAGKGMVENFVEVCAAHD
ncbi:anthranilate synthase component II [Halonotius roseus]|uniref:anthranilate synthase n=1 Tax=Halonotius roseus TaxID=2511997 RepID=A0A544QRU6_9EURY|nr:aminodeoxychorismate/anthranilate synthase component II [Halonotius roseus]TQQ82132.1 aminodeoxychorismate/anthranilate synthase component II [Halonotius roseus]